MAAKEVERGVSVPPHEAKRRSGRRVQVRRSGVHGKGVFALRDIAAGETLIEYIGEADLEAKNELLGDSLAMLFPIQWDEPFGLVMIEAMACGTPVIALQRGSVEEVVDFGKTGFYAKSIHELSSLVTRALSLDRRIVRDHASQRFGHARMTDEYLQVYESVLNVSANERANVVSARQS